MSTRSIFFNKREDELALSGLKGFLYQESLSRFRFALSLFAFFAGFGLLFGDPSQNGLQDPRWIRILHVSLIVLSFFCSYWMRTFRNISEYILLFHFGLMSIHSYYLLYSNGLYLGYLFGMILVSLSAGVSFNNRKLLIPYLLVFLSVAIFVGINCINPRIEVGMYYFGIVSSSILAVLILGFRLKTFDTLVQADAQLEKFQANIEEELQLAQSTQKSLVDLEFPETGAFRIHSYFRPLVSVGGDLIKSEAGSDGKLNFFFADAAGHGISAAMVSAMAVMAFKMTAPQTDSPAKALSLIHESLMTMIGGFFITAVYLRLDPKTKELVYAYAGHHPAVLIEDDGNVSQLEGRGTVLLALPQLRNRDYSRILKSGDRILLFSDGLFEFFGEGREFFGYDAFVSLVKKNSALRGKQLLSELGEDIASLHRSAMLDDMTMLLIEVV
ncbi:SpoIIE-like protein phosphatase domain protein [Leptospira broomii serovar Hurstbridge str. 5399]|uniref:SpoIIE-like protein phosphatase domain protein n=1 Tax=Leptospira broomii serovar Hurstbridge str. 5399 TaxID=1049789 RepID=T0F1W6_9LEPT|nr:PP2C family protein-serine/threonine phosphatase [Leptospira broomii]EQA45075.1 SpoIIE-like protein phosphatase domain protein [Leptospira broomii serovar Hurstbridge str. 5399]